MMHKRQEKTLPPQTQGNVVHWASMYDPCVKVLTLGQASRVRRETAELAQIKVGDAVLDVGCGTGDLTLVAREMAGAAGRVVGIDPALEMVAAASHKAAQIDTTIDFQVGVIEAIPFPENSFDVVLSSLMMHHLPGDLKMQGLAEILRVLRPNGRLLIVDLKRPTSFLSRNLLTLLLHGALQFGVQDLPVILKRLDFRNISVGNLSFRALGYVSARASKMATTI
jgi:ubiquinone/menaquinone biosynthesis C-methylase UbiE